MKKYLSKSALWSMPFLVFFSCTWEPGVEELSTKPVVATIYDTEENFAERVTYAIVDTVGIVDNGDRSKLNSSDASKLIGAVKSNMDSRGYTEVATSADPDYVLNILLLKDTDVGYIYYPGYWWGFYGGYYPWYPWWGGGYYPGYSYAYTYETGVQIIEMFDRKELPPSPSQPNAAKLVWTSYSGGVLNSKPINDAVESINQSFKQSTYITR
ncbi:MAG: DUF4136 domain-containing protein [Cytophagaceae bacterium]|jgi:hypothetical protein|nr:DUF4136 domain-containing protein [Cytophagaceae bacterium]